MAMSCRTSDAAGHRTSDETTSNGPLEDQFSPPKTILPAVQWRRYFDTLVARNFGHQDCRTANAVLCKIEYLTQYHSNLEYPSYPISTLRKVDLPCYATFPIRPARAMMAAEDRWTARFTMKNQATRKDTGRPNLLLLISDQHRGDWLGWLGYVPVRTPNLDRLAGDGVHFPNARTPSPVCAPARSCLALGCDYDQSPVRTNMESLPRGRTTFYGVLQEAGYDVRSVGKLDLLKPDMSWGADGQHVVEGASRFAELGFSGGRDSAGKHDGVKAFRKGILEPYTKALDAAGLAEVHAADYQQRQPAHTGLSPNAARRICPPPPQSFGNTQASPIPDGLYCDDWVATSAMRELEDLCMGDQPWCLVVNFSGPHEPLDATPSMRDGWRNVHFAPPSDNPYADRDLQNEIRRNYAAIIERIDAWCGKLLERLELLQQSEVTFVCYSADHGEMLGDSGLWGKAVPHEASVHIPMICAGAGVALQGATLTAPVSWIDLGATCLDLAGRPLNDTAGVSLKDTLRTGVGQRDVVFSGLGQWRSVFDGRYKLVAGFNPDAGPRENHLGRFNPASIATSQLYDTHIDKSDRYDVSAYYPQVLNDLRQKLNEHLADQLPMPELGDQAGASED